MINRMKKIMVLEEKLNCVNYLSFGSEEGALTLLNKIAEVLVLEPEVYINLLKKNLSLGLSFANARSKAVSEYLKDNSIIDIINKSNNILSIEYLKALKKLNSSITPITVKRLGALYNSRELYSQYSSATSIRAALKENNNLERLQVFMPSYSYDTITNSDLTYLDDIFPYLKYKGYTYGEKLKEIPDVKEGLENRVLKNILESRAMDELITKTISKRYPSTRINRILTQYFIGFEKYDTNSLRREIPQYGRILGFNDVGKDILKVIKKYSSIDLITKIPKNYNNQMLNLDLQCTAAYSLINKEIAYNEDFLCSPIIF